MKDCKVVTDALANLSRRRPLFHDEADLVRAFALTVHGLQPQFQMPRIEVKGVLPEKQKLDMLADFDGSRVAVEMKYVRAPINDGNPFQLKGEWYWPSSTSQPDDTIRFKFLKDIERLESVSEKYGDVQGYAVLITNKEALWNPPRGNNTHDRMFRIHERWIHGRLTWDKKTSPTTTGQTGKVVMIRGRYHIKWHHYSSIPGEKHDEFRYVTVHA